MKVHHFFDQATFTLTYIVYDEKSKDCVVIDPVLDFDYASGYLSDESASALHDFLQKNGLKPYYFLETHVHADHLSSAHFLKSRYYHDAKVAISRHITTVQKTFSEIFSLQGSVKTDGSQFDTLLEENKTYQAGTIEFSVIETPGHTPACLTFQFGDNLFTGDCQFMPDSGTGRCDFPGGSANTLYNSIAKKLYSLSNSLKIFVGHDYQPNGRELAFQTTVGEQKSKNIHIKADTSEEEFVKFRTARDQTLNAPKLLYPSLQINMNAGVLPDADAKGNRFLKVPLKTSKID